MYVRGKNVEYAKVCAIVDKVSAEKYAGNIIVHPDAGPIGNVTRHAVKDGHDYVSYANGYGFRGRIIGRVTEGPGTRNSASGRRGNYACWHAYRDVLRAIFAEYPHAVVTTAMARYAGSAGFEATYPRTADENVGSMFAPAYMPDLCNCNDVE